MGRFSDFFRCLTFVEVGAKRSLGGLLRGAYMPAGGLSRAPRFWRKKMKYGQNRSILGVVTDFWLKSVTKVRHDDFGENPW